MFEKVNELPVVRSFRLFPPAIAGAVEIRAIARRQALKDFIAELELALQIVELAQQAH